MAKYTGKSKEEMRKDVGRNRYFTPKQAIEYGLIDHIVQKRDKVRAIFGHWHLLLCWQVQVCGLLGNCLMCMGSLIFLCMYFTSGGWVKPMNQQIELWAPGLVETRTEARSGLIWLSYSYHVINQLLSHWRWWHISQTSYCGTALGDIMVTWSFTNFSPQAIALLLIT